MAALALCGLAAGDFDETFEHPPALFDVTAADVSYDFGVHDAATVVVVDAEHLIDNRNPRCGIAVVKGNLGPQRSRR